VSVLRTLVRSSRALITGAREVARFREIATVFITHGFGWAFSQMKLRRDLQVEKQGADLTRAALASPDTGKRLVAALTELGPTFVKLGQILSTRTDLLPQSILDELVTLQDRVDAIAFSEIEDQMKRNFGDDWRAKFERFDEAPLASASIAQVHRARFNGNEVVLKVQRPGVGPKIESDLGILHVMARWLEDAIEEAQTMDLQGIIVGFTKSISQELDFRIEARNIDRFRRLHRDNDRVVFPRVHEELSTGEVLCMDFLEGRPFRELINNGEPVEHLSTVYFNVAYKMLFTDGFFHGDLHPGNVLVMEGGQKLGILDCGMVGRLSPAMKEKVIDILYAVLNEDLEGVARTFYELAIRTDAVDYQKFEADVIELADRYLSGMPISEIQIGVLFGELVAGATHHSVRMPTDFTMMFKAIITTEGMAKTIAPDLDPIELARPFITEMVTDRYSPERLKQVAIADFSLMSRMFRTLPHSLPAVIEDVRAGKLALSLSTDTLVKQKHAADARLRRVVRAALTITCLVLGTYSLSLGLPVWSLVGVPVLTALFFLAAGLGLFSLVWR
jgi:ubiquinone biosynthesis protein